MHRFAEISEVSLGDRSRWSQGVEPSLQLAFFGQCRFEIVAEALERICEVGIEQGLLCARLTLRQFRDLRFERRPFGLAVYGLLCQLHVVAVVEGRESCGVGERVDYSPPDERLDAFASKTLLAAVSSFLEAVVPDAAIVVPGVGLAASERRTALAAQQAAQEVTQGRAAAAPNTYFIDTSLRPVPDRALQNG